MKINPSTGELTLVTGLVLSPGLTRSQFLESREGAASTVWIRNEPWCSYNLEEHDEKALVSVSFQEEVLKRVWIFLIDPKFGTGWDDWSEEKEMQRKEATDQWLIAHGLTPGKKYDWGSVWSGFDSKSGSSSGGVSYEMKDAKMSTRGAIASLITTLFRKSR